jgi:hypothetical protein
MAEIVMAELVLAEKNVHQLHHQMDTLLLDNKELASGMQRLLEENKRLRKEKAAMIQESLEQYSTLATVSTPLAQSDRTDKTIISKRIELPDYLLSKALNAELEWYRHTLNQTLENLARKEEARQKLKARLGYSIQDTPSSRVPSFEDVPQDCVLAIEDIFGKQDMLEPPQTKKGAKQDEDHEFVLDSWMMQSLIQIPAYQFPTGVGAYIDVTQSLEDLAKSRRNKKAPTQKSQRSTMGRRESKVVEHSGRSEYDEARVSGSFSTNKRNPDGDEGGSPSSSTDAVAAAHQFASTSNSSSRRRSRIQPATRANPRSMSHDEFEKDDNVLVPLRPNTLRKLDSLSRRRSTPEEASPPIKGSSYSENVLSDPFPRTEEAANTGAKPDASKYIAEGPLRLGRKRNASKNGKQLHSALVESASDSGNAMGSEPIFSIEKKQMSASVA